MNQFISVQLDQTLGKVWELRTTLKNHFHAGRCLLNNVWIGSLARYESGMHAWVASHEECPHTLGYVNFALSGIRFF